MSESGVHRPHVAGIHGRSNDGAYSLVLAGGYEDDIVSESALFMSENPPTTQLKQRLGFNYFLYNIRHFPILMKLTFLRRKLGKLQYAELRNRIV